MSHVPLSFCVSTGSLSPAAIRLAHCFRVALFLCYFYICYPFALKIHKVVENIRNSNPQSSGLVTESSVSFKTRQFWSLLSSHWIFWVSFNLLTSPTSWKPGYPLPHNMLLFAIAVMEGVWILDIIKKQGVASLVSAIDVQWDKWAITYLSLCASQLGKYPLVYLIDDFKLTEWKSSWCDKLDHHYVCGYVHVSRVFTPLCYVIFKLL